MSPEKIRRLRKILFWVFVALTVVNIVGINFSLALKHYTSAFFIAFSTWCSAATAVRLRTRIKEL